MRKKITVHGFKSDSELRSFMFFSSVFGASVNERITADGVCKNYGKLLKIFSAKYLCLFAQCANVIHSSHAFCNLVVANFMRVRRIWHSSKTISKTFRHPSHFDSYCRCEQFIKNKSNVSFWRFKSLQKKNRQKPEFSARSQYVFYFCVWNGIFRAFLVSKFDLGARSKYEAHIWWTTGRTSQRWTRQHHH